MTEVMIWSPVDRILWGVALLLSFICGLQYLIQGKKNEKSDEKLISYGFSSIFFGGTLGMIFHLLGDLHIPGTFLNNIFFGNYDDVSSTYYALIKGIHISNYSGFMLFFYAFDRIVKKTKYILTIISSCVVLSIIILPSNLVEYFSMNLFYLPVLLIFLTILLLYTKWSRFELKAVSSFILLGFVFISFSMAFLNPALKEFSTALIIAPAFWILGTFICLIPSIIDPKHFSQGLRYWKIVGALVISIDSVSILYFILFLPIYAVFVSVFLFFIIFSLFIIFNSVKTSIKSKKEEKLTDILGVFTRPQKITEEEISISKEKKICLVCKGKVGGVMFMCTNCGALYCVKCSEALSNLENLCWACDSPIDPSKPVKPYKEEKEEIEIESFEEIPKKFKK